MSHQLRRSFLGRLARGAGRRLHHWTDGFAAQRSLRAAGLARAKSIDSWTKPQELTALYGLALGCPERGAILEIGSHLGASTCYLAAGIAHRRGMITCIDTWQNDAMPEGRQDTYDEFCRNVTPVRERLRLVRRPVQEVSAHDLGETFDLVFIDAEHTFEAVSRDFALAASVLKLAGIIAFHDSAEFEGVSRAIGSVLATGDWSTVGVVENLLWIKRAKWRSV